MWNRPLAKASGNSMDWHDELPPLLSGGSVDRPLAKASRNSSNGAVEIQ